MKLEQLRALLIARTPGDWKFCDMQADPLAGDYRVESDVGNWLMDDSQYYPTAPDIEDARAIVAVMNLSDALIELYAASLHVVMHLEPTISPRLLNAVIGVHEKLEEL